MMVPHWNFNTKGRLHHQVHDINMSEIHENLANKLQLYTANDKGSENLNTN